GNDGEERKATIIQDMRAFPITVNSGEYSHIIILCPIADSVDCIFFHNRVLNGRMMCMLGYRGNHVFIIPEADVVIAKSASPPNIGEFDDTYGAMGDENGQIRMALEIAAHYIDKQNNSQPPAQSVYCPAACPKGHFIVGCDMNNPWHCLPGRKCLFGWNKNFGEIWVHGPYCGF
ncbi:hypothetical protein THAOC_11475, partial [Thalassiosira oceanica]